MTQLVVFDCDGTLVDSQSVILAAMRAAFAAQSLSPPADEAIRRIVGLSLPQAVHALLGDDRLPLDQGIVPALADSYKNAFIDLRHSHGHRHEPLYPGIEDTLIALGEAGVLMGIATGKSMRGLVSILEHHGLSDHFISLQTADLHPSKPHPAMLEAAIREAGAKAEQTILIGDTSYDMLMAKNAGAIGLGVSWGYHAPEDLEAAGAHIIADEAGQLPSVITGLYAGVPAIMSKRTVP
ncbi:haloacid dehalogenase [Iodidimonas muriae]|uniref:Haloacid dehalogenase n=1 Tax=Iodidimonas muriae TaxID=261467 RepID=A0ABQ2LG78_9PROT|nr:HAD-IA family hydrolase [Iodidimonas muriae]GGO17044.1 haloacid dehalogenase [Iodidimonas muriae]